MNKNIRRQLTLFVDPKDAEPIEQIRQEFNPRQFELIKSHITLCREDEIENLEQVISNLFSLTKTEIVIQFGKVARFDDGKGLFLGRGHARRTRCRPAFVQPKLGRVVA